VNIHQVSHKLDGALIAGGSLVEKLLKRCFVLRHTFARAILLNNDPFFGGLSDEG
jgi:hypothetical protein